MNTALSSVESYLRGKGLANTFSTKILEFLDNQVNRGTRKVEQQLKIAQNPFGFLDVQAYSTKNNRELSKQLRKMVNKYDAGEEWEFSRKTSESFQERTLWETIQATINKEEVLVGPGGEEPETPATPIATATTSEPVNTGRVTAYEAASSGSASTGSAEPEVVSPTARVIPTEQPGERPEIVQAVTSVGATPETSIPTVEQHVVMTTDMYLQSLIVAAGGSTAKNRNEYDRVLSRTKKGLQSVGTTPQDIEILMQRHTQQVNQAVELIRNNRFTQEELSNPDAVSDELRKEQIRKALSLALGVSPMGLLSLV